MVSFSETYDALGNLTQVVMPCGDVVQYVIDGQNRRVAKRVNGTITYKWAYARLASALAERAGQLSPIAELDSADNIIARFSGGCGSMVLIQRWKNSVRGIII